jgi:uncharacterized tellurite resistance protein B-like protein
MALSMDERRDLIALLCRVARADGQVVDQERERLSSVLTRVGEGSVSQAELDSWLRDGPPKVTRELSAQTQQMFMNEAMGVVAADRHIDPLELHAIRQILKSCFTRLEQLSAG